TLLFGLNSAGKSSLLHALIYAREVFERHNLDPDNTLTAGDTLDLGGFLSLVHQHDRGRTIRLLFNLDLATERIDLPGSWDYYDDSDVRDPEFVSLSSRVKTCGVGVTIAWADREVVPFVREYEISLNGRRFGRVVCETPGKGAHLVDLDVVHPVFGTEPIPG